MSTTESSGPSYADLLAQGRSLYPGVRIGKPGRARTYWATITAMRALRARWKVDVDGAGHVAPGAAILIGNHVSALDPVVVVISAWWRVSAFTKIEVFEKRGGLFFRLMGQIPLQRGDPASTEWAMKMAEQTLSRGGKIGIYPEGTRSPDPRHLHRLHQRILVPVLQANPDVPVHAVTTAFTRRSRRRIQVQVRISPPLHLDARTMTPDELTSRVRDALLELGGQTYVDVSARDAKRRKDQ